ncbi:hypothetical protein D3C81_1132840 [compost metagenome]
MTGRRTFAEILHLGIGTIRGFRFDLKTGRIIAVYRYLLGVNAFFFQLLQGEAAETVIADAADPADVQAQTCQTDRHVQFGTGNALGEDFHFRHIAGLACHEHGHGFTQGDDVQWCAMRGCQRCHDVLLRA